MNFKVGDTLSSDQAMKLAIDLAKRGQGAVAPNPLVGCVIVDREHKLLGAGAHLKYGKAHAEINALSSIPDKKLLLNATAYVTLEPCAHQGKTGSCARTLAQYPLARVVYGALDPNPLVAGKGANILQEAGIETELSKKFESTCQELAEQFFYHIIADKPFVALKAGASLDGKIALSNGDSQWITSEDSRFYARNIRAHYDATMIGAGTFINDNPSLDFRETAFDDVKKNRVVIVDPKGKGAEHYVKSKIAQLHHKDNLFVLCPQGENSNWKELGIKTIDWEPSAQGWSQALSELYQIGISSLYVEGGAYVFGQCLEHQLMQKLYLFQAPVILGKGLGWSDGYSISDLSNGLVAKAGESKSIGVDQLHVFRFSPK